MVSIRIVVLIWLHPPAPGNKIVLSRDSNVNQRGMMGQETGRTIWDIFRRLLIGMAAMRWRKLRSLSMNLFGLARQAWADSFSDLGSEVTYGALVSVLTKRFKPEGQGEACKAEFKCRNRRAEETFLEFGDALRRLAIRAFPRIAHEAREDMVIDQFLLGLSVVIWGDMSA